MNIAINCRFLLEGKLEGIGIYSLETIRRIVVAHPEHQFFLLFDRKYDPRFVFSDNCTPIVIAPPARHPFLWYFWFEWKLPAVLRKYKIDAFYSPDSYLSLRTQVPTTLIVHDLAYLHYPDAIPRFVLKYYEKYFPKFFAKAKYIGTVSHATATDMEASYPSDKWKDKVFYAPCAASEIFHPRSLKERQKIKENYTDGDDYFLFVGAIHPRKNVIQILKAFNKFKKFYHSSMKLILIGRKAWMSGEFDTYLEEHPYRKDIIHLEHSDQESLSALYGGAYALVYPSLFEGFGMPILESIQSGVPVLVSDSSSMPEVAGDAGILVDPKSTEDIAEKMGLLYTDEKLYGRLKNACPDQAAKFSWDRTAQKIWEHIESCLPSPD